MKRLEDLCINYRVTLIAEATLRIKADSRDEAIGIARTSVDEGDFSIQQIEVEEIK
jgi:hypothetical protein